MLQKPPAPLPLGEGGERLHRDVLFNRNLANINNMKHLTLSFCVSLSTLSLGGCADHGYPPGYGYGSGFSRHQKAIAGTAMGAAGGALLGGAITQDSDGAVVGGLLGGATGGLIGHSIDTRQRPQPSYYSGGYQQPYYGGKHHRHHDDDD